MAFLKLCPTYKKQKLALFQVFYTHAINLDGVLKKIEADKKSNSQRAFRTYFAYYF